LEGFDGRVSFLSTSPLAVQSGRERGQNSDKILHQVVCRILCQVHHFYPKGTQRLKPVEAQPGETTFLFYQEYIEIPFGQERVELGTIIVHATADLLDNMDNLPPFGFSISSEPIGLGR
jgi:hypothetical protein